MRFCLMIEGQEGITWEQWLAISRACERFGFEALFTSDHYLSVVGARGRGSSDAWTLLSALAARTERLRLGTLVSPVTFRLPVVLAKAATTVDAISGGRVEIGMGAGWWEEEHRTHGFPFPPSAERMDMLEEQLKIVHGLLTQESFSFEGRHYTLERCELLPKPVQRPHPPIIVGGSGGHRLARLAARWADEFNTVGGTPAEVAERFARVRDAVDRAGRDQGSFTTSFMTWVYVGEDDRTLRDRIERARALDPRAGTFDEFVAEIERDCIVGTPERAAARLSEYAAAGVQRVMLNHSLFDDLETIELLARRVLPLVEG
ncbi:MAG TPA: LLM class F420-dependent oxidoreductase [Actinomycetota bacterium]|nr:LLM class F420-dependent oxidoreductase [Actinomycetota bacterium]